MREMGADLRATSYKDLHARPAELMEQGRGFHAPATAHAAALAGATFREGMDLAHAGTIYLRPAYLPNNWAGNAFMNAVHQGVLAPVNLAKSLRMDKHLGLGLAEGTGKRYTAMIDESLGANPATALLSPKGGGYVSSVTRPLAKWMGSAADQPFRRAAWLHEARRSGYSKLSDVQKLMDRAATKGPQRQQALNEIADIGRRAQEEIVKFGHMSDAEKTYIRNMIFVYSWMKGATRYSARFALQHPIQANLYSKLGQNVGQPYLEKNLGGIPSYMTGAIPIGHDKNGNPILINPFALNPLSTGIQAAKAAIGTAKVATGGAIGGKFDQYTDTDIASLLPPPLQAYLNARTGGKAPATSMEKSIALLALKKGLEHPGSGSVYPTTRTEALGHFVGGSMMPRVADAQALARSLAREQQATPMARMPNDIDTIEKAFGKNTIDPEFIYNYEQDLSNVQALKDFQHEYASKHGSSGFRNMPAANRVDAALEFLGRGYMSPRDVAEIRREMKSMTNDQELSDLASSLWNSTGIGSTKSQWDDLLNQARKTHLSRARQ
jgi:hypothetical protein